MNRKQKIIVSVVGIFIVLLILVGLTYAYFLTRIKGNTNEKSITVNTTNLSLTYSDGNGILSPATKIRPGDNITFKTTGNETVNSKTFSVENTGDEETEFVIVIDNVNITDGNGNPTTFSSNDFEYTLTCTTTSGTCEGTSGVFKLEEDYILLGTKIPYNTTYNYELSLTYKETGIDQSADMKKTFEARVNIKNIGEINPYTSGTLAYNIINNAKLKKNGTELKAVPDTLVAQTISGQYEQVLSVTPDDLGTSYYYRGNVDDNYVDFAGMCWRVVRIDGNGNTRLILEDYDQTCSTSDGNWDIPISTSNSSTYVYYGYDKFTNTSGNNVYKANFINPSSNADTSMVTAFKNFQTNKLASNLSKLQSGNWCLNDDAYSDKTGTTKITDTEKSNSYNDDTDFYYDSYVRLYGKITPTPTLKCNGTVLEKYSDSTDLYVGTLTLDEITYAGGKIYDKNSYYYLKNGYNKLWWILTPRFYNNGEVTSNGYGKRVESLLAFVGYNSWSNDFTQALSSDNYYECNYRLLTTADCTNYSISSRPAINLKINASLSSGDGTKDSPYVIS